ncbi:hypothetical protein OG21DRAFT_1497038 [Imleria badia]|nr:hypothetical protein OG21DRAFT_1497038 [Imleria badia]
MSSALAASLSGLQQVDYTSVIIITAVVYDYVLAFSDEIEYIWKQPWTWVSMLYIFVCYCGLFSVVAPILASTTFIHSPAEVCKLLYIINQWSFLFFLGAADLIMILRVWSMYNRSRLVLSTLLVLFSAEMVCTIVISFMASDPRNLYVIVRHVLDQSRCVVYLPSPVWAKAATILEITIGATMCTLAIVQFITQSVQMYRVTNHWQISQYMNLLVRQGVFYFLAVSMFSIIIAIAAWGKSPTAEWLVRVLLVLEWVPSFAVSPRFILAIRKLYAHDVQRGRGEGIDSGFGLSLSGGGPLGMPMGFLDAEQNVGLKGVELSDYGAVGKANGFEHVEQKEGLDFLHDARGRRGEGIDAGFGLSSSGHGAGGMTMGFMDAVKDIEEISIEVEAPRAD